MLVELPQNCRVGEHEFYEIWLLLSLLHSRWFACARRGPMSMSQPRRSARLASQRERAESRPVEPVSIPLDDDTESLVSVAVCGECSSGNMVHIPCCDYAAHQGRVLNLPILAGQTCQMQWALLQCNLASSVAPKWSWGMSRTFFLLFFMAPLAMPGSTFVSSW